MKRESYKKRAFSVNYFKWRHLLAQAVISAFFIVYYTTEQSILVSLHSTVHLVLWVLTSIQMLIVAAACALISTYLDEKYPWHHNKPLRSILQVGLGVFVISLISLRVIYAVYELFLNVDLRNTDYFSRDFIVVLASIICFNGYHYILYLNTLIEQGGSPHRDDENEHAPAKAIDKELATPFQSTENGVEVRAAQIGLFFLLDSGKKRKTVCFIEWNGKEHIMSNADTLSEVQNTCPYLFISVSRHYLVNRYAIKKIRQDSGRKYALVLNIKGQEPIPISRYMYSQLQADMELTTQADQ